MRRLAAAVAAIALTAALGLAACGREGSQTSQESPLPTATATAEPTRPPSDAAAQPEPTATSSPAGAPTTSGAASSPPPTAADATAPPTVVPAPIEPGAVQRLTVEVLATTPHDSGSYTQGLVHDDGVLYESAGNYGESDVRRVDAASGAVIAQRDNDAEEFGEGLALVGDALWQLTWKEGTANVVDAATLQLLRTVAYEGEGWGLCYDGERLVMSDGSSRLTFRDPSNFAVLGAVDVTLDGDPVERLNELECVDGTVFANVYTSDLIVGIDPASGQVTATVDAAALREMAGPLDGDEVLNGIAHLGGTDRFLLTGKHWPTMFEVRFVPEAG